MRFIHYFFINITFLCSQGKEWHTTFTYDIIINSLDSICNNIILGLLNPRKRIVIYIRQEKGPTLVINQIFTLHWF